MATVQLRFPGGRYHATPWGHHVNEGLIEWPPSPWRLLRALVACGFSSQGWTDIPTLAQQLIFKLAAVLPSYRLPETTAAHSRHFMPVGRLEKGREQTTLVFDTWANIGDGTLLIHWPCELTDEESALLGQLATSLGYLGRSESWVEAELLADRSMQPEDFNAFPHQEGSHPGREHEQLSLMASVPPTEYSSWYQSVTDAALSDCPLPNGKKPTAKLRRDQAKAIAPYPADLLSCLTKDTSWWKGHGWSQPPGSRRVLYWRRSDAMQVTAPVPLNRPPTQSVSAMLLALTTPSGNKSALPHVSRTLPQAELMHAALVGRAGNGQRVACPELTGKDEHGRSLRDGHRHAHVLPLDLDSDQQIDHILIFAAMGLGDTAQRAIRSLRRTWTKGGVGDMQLALAGSGSFSDLRRLPDPLRLQIDRLLGPAEGAVLWTSLTPFVPPRHVKKKGRNSLLGQINSELASRGKPLVNRIQLLPWDGNTLGFRHYVRRRQRGGAPPPVDAGYALELHLSEPIVGPLTLGYASHFGLGLFAAVAGVS